MIVKKLFGTLTNKKIVILGFAFKNNTNDTRESAAIKISCDLLNESAKIIFHDPKVDRQQIENELKNYIENYSSMDFSRSKFTFSDNIYESAKDTDAILILTEWDEYKNIDWQIISKEMRSPSWVFDTRGIIDQEVFKIPGINFWQVGNGKYSEID